MSNNIIKFTAENSEVKAVALFRVSVVKNNVDSAYYSYNGKYGIYNISIISGHKLRTSVHDITIRFSTVSSDDKTPDVVVYDLYHDAIRGEYDYKIFVKDDGYAYFYILGKNAYDTFSYVINFACKPQDVDCLIEDNVTITASEFNNFTEPTLQIVDHVNNYNAILAQYGSANVSATGTNMHIAKTRQLSGDVMSIIGEVVVASSGVVQKGSIFRRLPFSVQRAVIYVDVISKKYDALPNGFDELANCVHRIPVLVKGNYIYAMCDIPSGAIISFNSLIYLSDVVSKNY